MGDLWMYFSSAKRGGRPHLVVFLSFFGFCYEICTRHIFLRSKITTFDQNVRLKSKVKKAPASPELPQGGTLSPEENHSGLAHSAGTELSRPVGIADGLTGMAFIGYLVSMICCSELKHDR